MNEQLIENQLIPLDKSWIIRMGVLDLLNGRDDSINFLKKQGSLGADLQALYNALLDWNSKEEIDVGESGTLYRFLQFASWKLCLPKKFIKRGTLNKRDICNNPEIVNYPLDALLKLDNSTSQWASAAVLLGNGEKVQNPPFKLNLTYEAVRHWKEQKALGECWLPRYDETILNQASAFLGFKTTGILKFKPEQAEDYCFARAFNLLSKEEGSVLFPSLAGHESNRLEEMEIQLEKAEKGEEITSKDHRVVQAIAMLQKSKGKKAKIKHPECVDKSWPQFWRFLKSQK